MNKPIMVASMVAYWAFVPPFAQAQIQGCPFGQGYGPMMGGWGFGSFGILGMILGLVFWLLLIVGIVYLIRYIIKGGGAAMLPGDRAMSILNERYAKGEITKEEYENMKRDLEGK